MLDKSREVEAGNMSDAEKLAYFKKKELQTVLEIKHYKAKLAYARERLKEYKRNIAELQDEK